MKAAPTVVIVRTILESHSLKPYIRSVQMSWTARRLKMNSKIDELIVWWENTTGNQCPIDCEGAGFIAAKNEASRMILDFIRQDIERMNISQLGQTYKQVRKIVRS
jgi:hypothetical protein